ncbi:molybdate ABC transporter substrate-binding protein [Aurantiacibacter suaedae]|uniref:molybdate ABC transporter substrate-binding protein n=1 Tax=Aurantiacibacter suaedae TaxID=2545755 RepID=UPI001F4F5032|nr:molybdate ABC transporter substrate-binding protein [Aurantiacibacter suaedae]
MLLGSVLLAACGSEREGSDGPPVVLAAASMQEALEAAADGWAAQGHARPLLSFSSSAVVARQAAEGAPADLVVTADQQWMDWMEQQHLLRPGTRRTIAGNTLVLVAPGEPGEGRSDVRAVLSGFSGHLALAEPETVPAGRYAMAALTRMGLAEDLATRIVPAENVRAALALVERGEVDLGIVYATDALASDKVTVLASFNPELHAPIRYPLAVLAESAQPEAEAFADYLESSAGQAILARHGFSPSR